MSDNTKNRIALNEFETRFHKWEEKYFNDEYTDDQIIQEVRDLAYDLCTYMMDEMEDEDCFTSADNALDAYEIDFPESNELAAAAGRRVYFSEAHQISETDWFQDVIFDLLSDFDWAVKYMTKD